MMGIKTSFKSQASPSPPLQVNAKVIICLPSLTLCGNEIKGNTSYFIP